MDEAQISGKENIGQHNNNKFVSRVYITNCMYFFMTAVQNIVTLNFTFKLTRLLFTPETVTLEIVALRSKG
jgi:hypothetical protein